MTEAPERIWAWIDQCPVARQMRMLEGEWSEDKPSDRFLSEVEYIRADDALAALEQVKLAERERCAAKVEKLGWSLSPKDLAAAIRGESDE